jgi:hypothetical protein
MTGRRSDEQTDIPQTQRSTDSESAGQSTYPTPQQAATVQDSPGNPETGVEESGELDEQGNHKGDDDMVDGPRG